MKHYESITEIDLLNQNDFYEKQLCANRRKSTQESKHKKL
jgi:hypothetical protein